MSDQINDWQEVPPDKINDWQEVPNEQYTPDSPGLLSQGIDFAKNLPESAIDLVPGMKQRREDIAAHRATPEYQNAPSSIEGQTQGQSDLADQQAGENDLNDPAMQVLGLFSPTSGYELIKGLSSIGSKLPFLGKQLEQAAPGMEATASKLAEESMGLNSAKGQTKIWNPETQQYDRGSNVIKGIGTTAMDQGVLGPGNQYDNALNALKTNSNRLAPLFSATQAKIDPNLPNLIDQVGPLASKTPQVVQDLLDEVSDTGQEQRLVKVLTKQYQIWEPQLSQADGNLQQLNDLKQQLTSAAEKVSPSVYNPNAPAPTSTSKMEGELYQRLAGVVRQHIEDLANAADSGAGTQIKQINKNIGNLSEMIPTLQAAQRTKLPTTWKELIRAGTGPIEKFAAKGLNAVSQGVNTPIGPIMQKTLPNLEKINNPLTSPTEQYQQPSPWSPQKSQNKVGATNQSNINPGQNVTRTASVLYNATDNSLLDVADQLKDKAGMEYTGDYLKKAIANNDMDAKNRAIFMIMQDKNAKALLTPIKSKGEEIA